MMAEALPARLKATRISLGYTQQQVAEYLGISVHAIRKYEREQLPNCTTMAKLARLYRTSADYLLGLDERPYISCEGLDKSQVALVTRMVRLFQDARGGERST